MAILEIKRAVERHLGAMNSQVPTGWEGVAFTPPSDQLYQRVQFLIQSPDDPVIGTGFYRERVTMQVFIVGMINKGTSEIITRAETVRNRFAKGLVLNEGNIKIHVLTTPQIAGVTVASDRMVCPVLIQLVAEVYSNN